MSSLFIETQSAFTQWHTQGDSHRRVPIMLKKRAIALLNHYSLKEVSHGLNISVSRLRYWLDSSAPYQPDNKTTSHFIPLSLPSTSEQNKAEESPPNESPQLSLSRVLINLPGNLQLVLTDQSAEPLCQLVCTLAKEFAHASLNR